MAGLELKWFCDRDDGYLRVIPDRETIVVYIKWKYTNGSWAGHYHFVSGFNSMVGSLLRNLREKLADTDAGLLKPHRDKPHGQ